jgi:hypothetical protein
VSGKAEGRIWTIPEPVRFVPEKKGRWARFFDTAPPTSHLPRRSKHDLRLNRRSCLPVEILPQNSIFAYNCTVRG